ncbi:FimV/HubP family polar landmark protein [Microbulbifer rhizosphaerae]|uniref:Pilus assembly protein FimV n=1 Tax=Microbulbifer rhizosphaerae TaxID=1562603 RepID=A0A7W4Z7I9_9GAMM|nr:FimV/HubP family polar landmark protein [Microbulbifer rhizosphaerae]MBB3059531.1 pilus assembly protein FimV [Microbulbifer rhizosphaerae]
MRVRKLALAVGLVSALGGNAALALGLGEIKLNSTLNQPLDAEIKLLQTRGLGDNEIKVRLAGHEDFERAGVDRSYLLNELKFDVDYSGGEPVIRISSRVPIREPFLNFLVETRWPSGRLLREYTLLMDLPAFSGEIAQQPVRAAERERQQVRRQAPVQKPLEQTRTEPVQAQQAPEPREQQPPTVEPEVQQPVAEEPLELRREIQTAQVQEDGGSRVYGPVAANQTLWEIAADNRVGGDLSVQQTMLAIQRLNPDAFINDNINLLKRGAVLRLPSAEDVRALTLTEAIAEVASQNESWRQRSGAEPATGAPLDARAATEDAPAAESVEGRVSLAAPGDNESVLSGSGSGTGDSEALAGELTVTEEELDKSRLENEELQERISELDEQIDTMERLVEVSNEEMQAVQAAAEQSGSEEEAVDGAPEETEEFAEAETATGEEEAPVEEETSEEEVEAGSNRNRMVTVQTQPEPTLVDRLMDNIQLIGIAAGALLIGLFAFFTWRRRKEEEEAIRQVEAEMAAERTLATAPELSAADENLSAVENVQVEDNFDLDQLDDVDTGDPVSEAEIHLSLGQYGDAENKLLAGLETAPDNVEARLMLLEVYAHQQSIDKFDDHYRQLLSVSDGPVADRAARLRESIAGAPPFEAPAMDFSSESLEATQLDDISASFEDDFSSASSSSGFESSSSSDFESEGEGDSSLLDDLTMDLSFDSGSDTAGDDDGEFTLDLELDTDLGDDTTDERESESEGEEFNLDDLMSGGELDLGDMDGGSDSAEPEQIAESDDGGLDFDLDLSPMEDAGAAELEDFSTSSEIASEDDLGDLSLDDLESFGGELDGGLDLDSIDLDDIAGLDGSLAAESDTDVAVAEEKPPQPQPQPKQSAVQEPAAEQDASADLGDLSFNLESDLDSELNLLEGSDEISTKLELAQAYLDMGDREGAKDILSEVVEEGGDEHKRRAKEMLERMA